MLYRKKPIAVEAMKISYSNLREIMEFCPVCVPEYSFIEYANLDGTRYCRGFEGLKIRTLEGEMTAHVGDYIIKGVNGEFYPCKSDIFNKTYELVL